MQLEDYIAETLSANVRGVKKSQEECAESNAIIAPSNESGDIIRSTGQQIQHVEFEVGLTVEGGTKTKGGIGVFAGVLNADSAGQSENSQTAVNTIRFSVSIALPMDEKAEAAKKRTHHSPRGFSALP